jgi:hypothetical protein
MKEPAELNIRQKLEDLSTQRGKWEIGVFKTSNDMLYGILQQCYALEEIMGTEQQSELDDYCKQHNIKVKSSANPTAKIIKCVFPIDRRRVSTYVTALKAAKENDIPDDALSDWIEEKGGLLEISLRRSPNYKTDAQRAVEVKQVVLQQPVLATLDNVALTAKYKFKSSEDAVLLLATQNPNGQFEIRQVIQSESVINAALRSCYGKAICQKQIQNTAQPTVDVQKQTLDVVDALTAQLSQRVA